MCDMTRGREERQIERDTVKSGVHSSKPGVTLCQLPGTPLAPPLPIKRPHLPVLWE